ncbi:MAG TPA: helix-turn-helix transcriptional regulator [Chitinophaga sp.]|uniref:helix-turn-helix domain-containing protein n=1 Tax=Chitinophaga sp. TaxID=1869181 RepID=UPI002F939C2D
MPAQKNTTIYKTEKLENFRGDMLMQYPNAPLIPERGNVVIHSRHDMPCKTHCASNRRDYYKITLVTAGSGRLMLGAKQYVINSPVLIFTNPIETKIWETDTAQEGYNCLFTQQLFEKHRHYRDEVTRHPLFQVGADAVLPLTDAQVNTLQTIFQQLMREYNDTAAYREEAILIYLQLLLLEAKRIGMQASDTHIPLNAGQMLAQRFTDMLEKQFPIETPAQQLSIRAAREYAQLLNVHPNHLNATVKQVTGRTVSEHIRHRVLLEAKLLLLHTDWHIAAIAWSLGFEEPGNFTHFFKSQTGQSPHLFRIS